MTAAADAPLTISLRPGPTWDSYATTAFPDQADAVRYVRAAAVRDVVRGALEALEDDDPRGATRILRTCLSAL